MSLKYLQEKTLIQKSHSCKGLYSLVVDKYQKATTCPVCLELLRFDSDVQNFLEKGACADCVDTYYYPNSAKWNNGWRPNLKGEKNDI
jgi:hypothetical protein